MKLVGVCVVLAFMSSNTAQASTVFVQPYIGSGGYSGDDGCGNYTAINATGATIATVRAYGYQNPWCQHVMCWARLTSKTLSQRDKYYPFLGLSQHNSFIDTWTNWWAWAMFSLEVIMVGFQIADIYLVDHVYNGPKETSQTASGQRNSLERRLDRAHGPARWGTRWIGFGYVLLGIAEFIWFLASQYAQPGLIVFWTGNILLTTQMLIPILLMSNGMMMMWSSFVYRHNSSESLTARLIVPFLVVINIIIIGFFILMYANELDLTSMRTCISWGASLFIAGFLPYMFSLVHSHFGADVTHINYTEAASATKRERAWSDFTHIRLGLAVLWFVGAALVASIVPNNIICALLNVNDKQTDSMVWIGIIGLYAVISLILYFIWWAIIFHNNYMIAAKQDGEVTCCSAAGNMCCSIESSDDLFHGEASKNLLTESEQRRGSSRRTTNSAL